LHFITGGAFNGKRAWVKKRYGVEKDGNWFSAYDHAPLPLHIIHEQDVLVLEGIEIWLKCLAQQYDLQQSRNIWNQCIAEWLEWEKQQDCRKLIVIGTDLSKGIVPLEKENRIWRDLTGWAYQDTVLMAEKVDVIWYGLNQTIK
jgi:adenosyl cobinamide kinase/adenosyl cobinamide phosphate guanylyltransferase